MTIVLQSANLNYTAPLPPEDVQQWIPQSSEGFGADLWKVFTAALQTLQPELAEAAAACIGILGVMIVLSILRTLPGKASSASDLVGVLAVCALLLQQTGTLIQLTAKTVQELSEYGKLLIPVMTAAMASQGALTTSTALYSATALLNALLTKGIAVLLIPMIYIYLALAAAASATGEKLLDSLGDFVQWLTGWCLKLILYVFTGYMSITGVVSGSVDAAAIKATKLTMSGFVPVVGGILSDASDAVLLGASVMKNSVGVAGLVALFAIWIAPFLRIACMYLCLKLTAALCDAFDVPKVNGLLKRFSSAMGLLLGMTASVCIMLLVSVVCFMKGVA